MVVSVGVQFQRRRCSVLATEVFSFSGPTVQLYAPSAAGIDVWVGSGKKTVDAVMCIVDLMKRDSEIKIMIGCTEEEKMEVYKTHNVTPYMKGVLIRR